MKVLVTGASGLLGTALLPALEGAGHEPARLVRCEPDYSRGELHWDPVACRVDSGRMENVGAVVHLAGENLAGGKWTPEKKKRIRESRVEGTRLLSESIAGLENPPEVFISASATGYYGDRGDEWLDEKSPPGRGFVAELCRAWEEAATPAVEAGIHTVLLRTGIVLAPEGGALAEMLPLFKLGLGGAMGGGRHYMSWISIRDVVGAVLHIIGNRDISGPVNAVSPDPVRNREFAAMLGRALSRPAVLPVPRFAMRAVYGELADEILLASARVWPSALLSSGYNFIDSDLAGALDTLLDRQQKT